MQSQNILKQLKKLNSVYRSLTEHYGNDAANYSADSRNL